MLVDLTDLRAELLIITNHAITVICNISVLDPGLHFCLLLYCIITNINFCMVNYVPEIV